MPLKIMPHGRLQEWVAEEKGYFAAEGLDYTFVRNDSDYGIHTTRRDVMYHRCRRAASASRRM